MRLSPSRPSWKRLALRSRLSKFTLTSLNRAGTKVPALSFWQNSSTASLNRRHFCGNAVCTFGACVSRAWCAGRSLSIAQDDNGDGKEKQQKTACSKEQAVCTVSNLSKRRPSRSCAWRACRSRRTRRKRFPVPEACSGRKRRPFPSFPARSPARRTTWSWQSRPRSP